MNTVRYPNSDKNNLPVLIASHGSPLHLWSEWVANIRDALQIITTISWPFHKWIIFVWYVVWLLFNLTFDFTSDKLWYPLFSVRKLYVLFYTSLSISCYEWMILSGSCSHTGLACIVLCDNGQLFVTLRSNIWNTLGSDVTPNL